MKVISLVEREGRSRSVKMDKVTSETVHDRLRRNVNPASRLMTDEVNYYKSAHFKNKDRVHHTAREYVRGDVHTNTIEGFFSVFKRGMKGIYQHCDEKHLGRYLAKFDFRYSNRVALGVGDKQPTVRALKA
jgi:ISXO2-like transposase domain